MQHIYLIRHTTPLVAKGICYGQTDVDVTDTFLAEANSIKKVLPKNMETIYSSPLQRCSKLAQVLFANQVIQYEPMLMEINCGSWEMQNWDDIPKEEIDPWMDDFVNVTIPEGESYVDIYNRVVNAFRNICNKHHSENVAIVAHGGVLRSILAYITNTVLVDSFNAFTIHYGAVVKIERVTNGFTHQFLSNIPTAKEQHQPTYY